MAFITTLFVMFAIGMMMIGFVYMIQNEAFLAGRSRNASIALGIAEAGIQEALARIRLLTIVPGASSFTNSLAKNSVLSPGSSNTVAYQAALKFGAVASSIYPVTSTATFSGVRRLVRSYVLAQFKPGASNVIFTPSANFNSNAVPISGDSYAYGNIFFQSSNVPACGAGASLTNLPPPQVLAGTTITWQSVQPGCGVPGSGPGNYVTECASGSLSEVAPTNCPRPATNDMPYNFHPMVPIAMNQADFLAVLNFVAGGGILPSGMSLQQATQSGNPMWTGNLVTFTTPTGLRPGCTPGPCYPAAYVDKAMLIVSGDGTPGKPNKFCVNSSTLAVGAFTGSCGPGFTLYGDNTATNTQTRFVDWGLIQADTVSGRATTFFQSPMCAAPCPASAAGYQNGIRYIPLPPTIPGLDLTQPSQVRALACNQNINPGINVVDNTAGVTLSPPCGPGITVMNAPTVTFTGTKTNPESLIILNNTGSANAVVVNGSPTPGALPASCTPYSWFDTYNWGQILASGDLTVNSSFAFAGFIYARGNITFNSDTALWGGVYSQGNSANFLTLNSTTTFCGGTQISMLNPLQMNYSQFVWQDPTGAAGIR